MWGNAVTSLIDRAIQDPLAADRPELASHPIGRLGFGLMSFSYGFFRNVITHIVDTVKAQVHEAFQDARDAGHGRTISGLAAAPTAAKAAGKISTFGALLAAGSYLTTALRYRLMAPDEWQKHEAAGDLHDWLLDQAISRSGLNGPLDPLSQAMNGLRYNHDLSGLIAGAQAGYFLDAGQNILKWAAGEGSPNTNTAAFNGIKGILNMFAVPAAGIALSSVPGGPLFRAAAGYGLMRYTGSDTTAGIARDLVGPKGTGVGGVPPPGSANTLPGMEAPSGTGSGGGGIPIELYDDIAIPAAKAGLPLLQKLPGPLKVLGGVGLAGAFANHLAGEFARYDKPPGE